ncbi:MAG: restriction endonuclease [Methanocellales archaeon]|nr:restriction endonuclease [Methanocellales archaeon]
MNSITYDLLRDVFTAHGYEVSTSFDFRTGSDMLIAQKGTEKILIMFSRDGSYYDVKRMEEMVRAKGGRGLLVTTASFSPEAQSFAERNGMSLWNKAELEAQIGRAFLAKAEGRVPDLGLAPETTGVISDFFALGTDSTGIIEEHSNSTSLSLQLRSVPVNISKQNAMLIAGDNVGRIEHMMLKFVPFWQYRYRFDQRKQYKSKTLSLSGDGFGAVNALSGENKFVQYEAQDKAQIPDGNYEIVESTMSKEKARQIALREIIKEHTKRIKVNEVVGETLIFENKPFKPDPDDISIDLNLIYIPVWTVKGLARSIEIDAYDGRILSRAMDSDAEFV